MSVTDDLLNNFFFTQRFQNVITERLAFIQVLLPRDAMHKRGVLAVGWCQSVRLYVRPTHSCIVSKQLKDIIRQFLGMVAQ